jgi:ABC-2 type transport system ATP-binding protein
MPVDRPRRALLDAPDDVESYVAKRSLGFTQADSGDRIVMRAASAAGAFEPSAVPAQIQVGDRDHVATSDLSRPRRAVPAELFHRDFDDEEPTPTDARAAGRRAIVDLELSKPARPASSSQPARAELQAALRALRPQHDAPPSPPLEPVVELPELTALEVRAPDPEPIAAQPVAPSADRMTPAAQPELTQPYRPTRLIDGPTTSLPQAPPVIRPTPQITRPAPIRPAPTLRAADPPMPPARPRSEQTVRRPVAPAAGRARSSRPTVHHDVPPIIVDRLIKSYNGSLAVHNLSFVVEPGRVTGFLGPNGAGKTTTMRILVGLITPTAGTATFGNLAYADLPHPQRTVGCVLDTRFHPGRSGRNHLRVLAPTAGASDRRVDHLLREVGLGEVARQPVGEYSMGMQQRLALAAAMLGDPDYLILDEPANGLDPEGTRWLRTFLRDFAASGRAVLISSHLLNEIEAAADDIVVINRGRLLAQMPMSELSAGEGITRARVSDLRAALQTLSAIGVEVETAADERGAYLRILTHDVAQVGSALFSSGIVVDELVTERRDLEQEFFSMLEGSR